MTRPTKAVGRSLARVPPYERGIPFHQWRMAEIHRQCEEYLRTAPDNTALAAKKIWEPRDSYGWRSLP